MPSPRRGRILLVLGAILIVAGLIAVLYATFPAQTQSVTSVAPNDSQFEYFTEFEFRVLSGGRVQGTFSVVNNTPVTVFVFNDVNYNAYVNGANVTNLTSLYMVTAVNGTLDLAVPGFNTYHIVFAHGPGYGNQEQDVAVDLTGTGIDPLYFLGGLVAAAIGAVLVVVGVRHGRRSRSPAPSGVLDSRATYLPPPAAPPAPGTPLPRGEAFPVPPPLPGTADAAETPAAATPTGNVVVTLENASGGAETVQLLVNGAPVTTLTLSPGTTQVTTVTARLASPFGSMVSVQALTASGRRSEESVFVGAGGTAPLRIRVA